MQECHLTKLILRLVDLIHLWNAHQLLVLIDVLKLCMLVLYHQALLILVRDRGALVNEGGRIEYLIVHATVNILP